MGYVWGRESVSTGWVSGMLYNVSVSIGWVSDVQDHVSVSTVWVSNIWDHMHVSTGSVIYVHVVLYLLEHYG